MTVVNIRFRTEDELVALQVETRSDSDYYGDQQSTLWRDAKVEDLLEVAAFVCNLQLLESRIKQLEADFMQRVMSA